MYELIFIMHLRVGSFGVKAHKEKCRTWDSRPLETEVIWSDSFLLVIYGAQSLSSNK